MTLCPSASRLLLIHPSILCAATFLLSFSLPHLPSTVCPSVSLSLDAGFHYTSIGLWLLPPPQAPVSSPPTAAQSPRLDISKPSIPFSPSCFLHLSSSFSHHLPLFCFVLLVLCTSILTIFTVTQPVPPSFSILPPSAPSLRFPLSCFPLFLSCSLTGWSFISVAMSPPHHLPLLYSSGCLSSNIFLFSLSIFLSAIDGGVGCWPNTSGGWREGSLFAIFSDCPLSFFFLLVCTSQDLLFLAFLDASCPFLHHSVCCHSAVCLYFPCCQQLAWPEWQLKHCEGPLFSVWWWYHWTDLDRRRYTSPERKL